MTVLDKRAASGINPRKLGEYVAVALVAGAIGVGSVLGIAAIDGSDRFGPAEIEQAKAAVFVDHLENKWIAQVNATRAADLVESHRAPFMARVAEIQRQRAADMVDRYTNSHRASPAAVYEQRASDMVELQYGRAQSDR